MDRSDHRDSKPLQSGATPGHPSKKLFNNKFNNNLIKDYSMNTTHSQTYPATKKTRTYHKNQSLFALISKMRLWPSRQGYLHGLKEIVINNNTATLTTHCGHTFVVNNSRTSRASRWIRNKTIIKPCKACTVPDWKLEKYQGTQFKKKHGARLDVKGSSHE